MAVLAVTWGRDLGPVLVLAVALALIGAVLAAVHHAQVLARRVGEPFGSLIFAVAVTVIQVGLIVVLMISGGPSTASLARDTVFAAVMIALNGIVGLALFVGAGRHGAVLFSAKGTGAALATIVSLITLALVLPTFTSSPTQDRIPFDPNCFRCGAPGRHGGPAHRDRTESRQPTAAMAGLSVTLLKVALGVRAIFVSGNTIRSVWDVLCQRTSATRCGARCPSRTRFGHLR
ncbi:Sodium/calcium exchanger protein [Rhodococcus koreensis]|uniref:Sodium/calcium exchanger protein n=1 Tax=Rhodococcus koreensis TaxID=99653 RepID=A0A1H4IIM9_9NOCA|nr:Sodium/calcium exchanger protein [Rhodococcus koreensis]